MLNIDSIENGIVIDHITAGRAMRIYELLELDKLDTCVAIIKNAKSEKYGRKDIIKIEGVMNIDLDVLGFMDDNATVCVIRGGKLVETKQKEAPSAPKAGECGILQKSPVHHLCGACGPDLHPLRRAEPPLSLHLLRAGVQEVRLL